MSTTPVVTLSSASGSFPFLTKRISLTSGSKTVLGSTEGISVGIQQTARTPTTSNGWFPARATGDITTPKISPLPLSSSHAEIWCEGGRVSLLHASRLCFYWSQVHVKVYIRDLSSAFGTFINGLKISQVTSLKTGDTVVCFSSFIFF